MTIDNDLIVQWEPKIHKFLQTTFVLGMDKEDLAQELRIAIIKAAKHYNWGKGVTFHTYLHTVMVNTIRTLISKAQKMKDLNEAYSISGTGRVEWEPQKENFVSNEINRSLIDPISLDNMQEMELQDILERAKLSKQEFDFIELRMDGLTMEQITNTLGDSAYKIRTSIQKKIKQVSKGEKFFHEEKVS